MSEEDEMQELVVKTATQAIEEQIKKTEETAKQVEEAKKPKLTADLDYSFLVTKDDFRRELSNVREENKELKDILLRVKAQGKAHIEEKQAESLSELKKIYGDSLKFEPR